MSRVEVFKTNVQTRLPSQKIAACLGSLYEGAQISFDLEDIDRILRIASSQEVNIDLVAGVVSTFGFQVEVLPDDVACLQPPATGNRKPGTI